MCEGLARLEQALLTFSAGFDASRLTCEHAAALLANVSVIERAAAALSVQLSVRVAESGSWRAAGDVSAAHQLARHAGLSLGAAQQRLDTGRRLAALPEVAAAANAGALSTGQLAAVSDAADADPGAAGRLVALAGRASIGELAQECRRTKAATARDGELRRARIHACRSLRCYTDAEGSGHLRLIENPEIIAGLMAAIGPTRERVFQATRQGGHRERSDALDADALTTFIRDAAAHTCPRSGSPVTADLSRADSGPAGDDVVPLPTTRGGPVSAGRAKILVRVDFDTLLRGYPISEEVCEIAGYGPVAVSAVTDMIATGNPVLIALATRGRQVTGVASLTRRPTAAQDHALLWLQPECVVEGCHQNQHLERDHRDRWADTKVTLVDGLDRLCPHHHRLKTHHDWALVPGVGKRPFVSPSDPRHPRFHPPSNPRTAQAVVDDRTLPSSGEPHLPPADHSPVALASTHSARADPVPH